jgi:hypothetical protein
LRCKQEEYASKQLLHWFWYHHWLENFLRLLHQFHLLTHAFY